METEGETPSNEPLNGSGRDPLSTTSLCFLCQKDLGSLGEVEIYLHVNSCLDSSENTTRMLTTGEFPLAKTPNAIYHLESSPGYSKSSTNSSAPPDEANQWNEDSRLSCHTTSGEVFFSTNGNRTLTNVVNEHDQATDEDFVTHFPPLKQCSTIQANRRSKPTKSDLVEDEELLQTALVISATLAKTNIEITSLGMKERARRLSISDHTILKIPWKHEKERTFDERVLRALRFEQDKLITNEKGLWLERRGGIRGSPNVEIPFSLWRLTKGDGSNEDYLSEWMKHSDWKTEKPFDLNPAIDVLTLSSTSIELGIGCFPDVSRSLEQFPSLKAG
jgi:hypothetical protein